MLAAFRFRVLGLLKLNGSPHGIALGFTLGLALSLIPIPFLGMLVALALAPVLGGNLPATYAGSAVVNPLTGPAIYFAELWAGAQLLEIDAPSWVQARAFESDQWFALFAELLPAFGLGGLVVASGAALLAYPLLRLLVMRVQSRVAEAGEDPPVE